MYIIIYICYSIANIDSKNYKVPITRNPTFTMLLTPESLLHNTTATSIAITFFFFATIFSTIGHEVR